jgi:hypothetical protein
MRYECSEYINPYLNIHISSTHSHQPEEEIARKIAAKVASVNEPRNTYQIYITEFIQPKVIYSCSTSRKVVFFKASV